MALVSDYGGIKPSLFDYQPYKTTIETISALLLLYSIIEEEFSVHGVTLHFFQKSIFGKKQKGFLQLEYLTGNHIDATKRFDVDGRPMAAYTDLLIGMYYGSAYNSVNWSEQYRTLSMQSPEKQILSYGILLENIDGQITAIRTLQAEEFNSTNDIMMLNTGRMAYFRKNIELLERVKGKFTFFEKFLSKSDYQPVINEQ